MESCITALGIIKQFFIIETMRGRGIIQPKVKIMAENNNIKILSLGCRLNALEAEKIQQKLAGVMDAAVLVNTCAVTGEAERQSGQTVRKLARENPNAPIFVTGCAATRNPDLFYQIPNAIVIKNSDKMNTDAYINALAAAPCHFTTPRIDTFNHQSAKLSKQFIQVQNGCNHKCAYCVTRLLRGPAVSFPYTDILSDVRVAIQNGFYEIVLTGVDTASYARDGMLISDVCRNLLNDVPEIRRLRISSFDPAVPEIFKIIDLMRTDKRMMPHMHLSMQSGSDTILRAMGRRHSADTVRRIVEYAGNDITFSWDIICGFPSETDELFKETLDLVRIARPIKIHAFPFSARPDTKAFNMPNQVNRSISKKRVHQITQMANEIRHQFMTVALGQTVSVLVEENNIARTPHDIDVKIIGNAVPARTICNVKLLKIQDDMYIGEIA